MSDPRSAQEYLELFARNQRATGFGFESAMHVPCPFCAAPDFMVCKILLTEACWKKGATCKECGRSAKAVSSFEAGGRGFEIVQTGGPDAPAWQNPKMRRVA